MTFLPLKLAIILLLHIPFVFSSLPSPNGTNVTTLDVSDCPSSNSIRTSWDIIWSCAATLFACTWTAIHPNIPGMREGKFTVLSRHLGIMLVALIAPELMITWATLQFLSARDAAKAFNDAFGTQLHQARSDHPDIGESAATLLNEFPTSDGSNTQIPSAPHISSRKFREWTVTHGFFAWMGGFMLYVNDKPRATLTPDELLGFVREGSVEMPDIVEADLEDRSKGDALSKGIAIIQLGWFILQLVTRYVQNLPMTLLEIDTLAVAGLTCIAYGFWWKKPKDVGRPHAVHWKATASRPTKLAYNIIGKIYPGGWGDVVISSAIMPLNLMGIWLSNSSLAVRSRRVPSVGGYDEASWDSVWSDALSGLEYYLSAASDVPWGLPCDSSYTGTYCSTADLHHLGE
ncbi:uncharacterized protein BJ212DRAFT_1577825 [Suillus subaureus]|uniref:Uncharacterized protein n=1 Tax=Suillus subaureus TaxID=48587 RepID=A0A9P7JCK3_9AGAM|nr:uncharacterized protein BJ212DRAFT_1577825 [Suillus subaureus]KAG1814687.1 hypothetical protein BJ212DRAFT_1577825 [Suillus subaureus]